MTNTENRILEIRAAEGGADARLFVAELAIAYLKMADRHGWKAVVSEAPDRRKGQRFLSIDISGRNCCQLDQEAGGHRIQRVPKNEKRGRVHTSTVTVAVLKRADATSQSGDLLDDDIEVEWYSGSGAGGQHRNKHQNSVRLRHRATGIVKTAQKRSREASLKEARKALEQEIQNLKSAHAAERMNSNRRNQVGSGMRGDKCRTYRFQDDIVVDDVTGKRAKASGVMRGGFQALWR